MNFITRYLQSRKWSDEKKQELLKSLFQLISYDPQADAMLKMALNDGFKIEVSGRLIGTNVLADYDRNKQKIRVSPDGAPLDVVASLVHELRHYWQYKKLGMVDDPLRKKNMPLRLSFVFNRVIEADAHAFEENFKRILRDKMNIKRESEFFVYKEYPKLDAGTQECMKDSFMGSLRRLKPYDVSRARAISALTISRLIRAIIGNSKSVMPTIKSMRMLLTADIGKDAAGYMDHLTDRQFEALVLKTAKREAWTTVWLSEKFREAVNKNDKATEKRLKKTIAVYLDFLRKNRL